MIAWGNLGVNVILLPEIKEREMSDIKKDAFTELGHAALNARHNNTPPERAEAARLTLIGGLPPLPPHVALMTETPWDKVAMVAISPDGKIAVLGIEPNGNKEVVEWTVIDRRWTCRVITSTDGDYRVDHLHYPEGSEDVAFTVTAPDGKTRVYWGDWKIDASNSAKVMEVYFFKRVLTVPGHDMKCCAVVSDNSSYQFIDIYPLHESRLGNIAHAYKVLDYLEEKGFLVVCEGSKSGQSRLVLMDVRRREINWESDWYDRILEDSVMERDGEFSFVAFVPEHPPMKEVLFVTPSSERMHS